MRRTTARRERGGGVIPPSAHAPRQMLTCYFYRTYVIKNNMSPKDTLSGLSRRERQIMDVLYRLGRATANDVLGELPGASSHSTVRTQLRVLESKGHVRHEEQGLRYVYFPTTSRHAARRSAPQASGRNVLRRIQRESCRGTARRRSAPNLR